MFNIISKIIDIFKDYFNKPKEDITNLLNNFNFDNLNNDLMKTRHVESIFYNLKYFKNVEAITRENIFLKTSGSADFTKLKARFNTLLPLKKKYEKFSNFWKIYTVKFMENMSICLVNLEEAKAQRILLTTGKKIIFLSFKLYYDFTSNFVLFKGKITLLFVSFQNIAKQKTNNVDISKEEFFLLGVNFICDLAELFNASVLLGCSANFDSLDDICVSWYPKGFKLISKGKDKHRQIPVDYFGCYHPNRFNYEFDITKMCRFGHREKYTPIYRYPHPIQLCDIVIKTKI